MHDFTRQLQIYSTTPDIQRNQALFNFGYIPVRDSVQKKIVEISRDYLVNMGKASVAKRMINSDLPNSKDTNEVDDASELLTKLMNNPETAALLKALAINIRDFLLYSL